MTITPIEIIAPAVTALATAAVSIGARAVTATAVNKNALKEMNKKVAAKTNKKLDELNAELPEGATPLTAENLTEEQLQECQLTEEEIAKINKKHVRGANAAYIGISTVFSVVAGIACYKVINTMTDTPAENAPAALCANGVVRATV